MIRLLLAAVCVWAFAISPASAQISAGAKAKLDALKSEPTVRELQEAALQYFRVNNEQINSMRSRASLKGLAPVFEVSGGFARSDMDEQTDNYLLGLQPWIVRGALGDGYDVRGKVSWNFGQLVFNAEELDVASLAGLVEGILKEATRLYYMRRRLQVDMILTPPTDQASLLTKQLRLEELTGLLDAMSGGWFQEELSRRGLRTQAPSAPVNSVQPSAPAVPAAPSP